MTTTNNQIQSYLESMSKKIDDLIAALPNTYVSIRAHEVQIKSHEEKIADNARRLDAIVASFEEWKQTNGQSSQDQHTEMRNNWTSEVREVRVDMKEVAAKLDIVATNVVTITEQNKHTSAFVAWAVGIASTVLTSSILLLIAGFITHHITF